MTGERIKWLLSSDNYLKTDPVTAILENQTAFRTNKNPENQ